MTQHLTTDALRDLLATDAVVGPREAVDAIAGALAGTQRATLYLRVLPSETWAERLSEPEQKRARTVLRALLDGELWSRRELSLRCKLPDRALRDSIEELRRAGFPILARSKKPGGYRLTDEPAAPERDGSR